jgi:hypothetical protein
MLCWMFDLQLNMAMVCGQLASYGLITQPVYFKSSSPSFSEDSDAKSAQHIVWKTLFTSGYQVCRYSPGLFNCLDQVDPNSQLVKVQFLKVVR